MVAPFDGAHLPSDARHGLFHRAVSPFARGAVCFSWDDGFESNHRLAVEATARGQRHTFGITTDLIGDSGRLTATQIAEMHEQGHEIASHAVTHVAMNAQTQAAREIEYDDSKTALEAIVGEGNVTTWIYPYGGSTRDITTDQELHLRYDRLLDTTGVSQRRWAYPVTERESFVIGRYPWTSDTAIHNGLLEAIKLAARQPVIVCVYGHDPDSTDDPTWAQTLEAMDLCESLGVPCLTYAEAFPGGPALMNPNFSTGDLAGWYVSQGTAEVVADTVPDGFTGAHSVKLSNAADTGTSQIEQIVPVRPGHKYTFSGRYRSSITSGAGTIRALLLARNADATSIGSAQTASLTGTSWTQFSVEYTMPENTAFGRVVLQLNNLNAETWFTHLHLGLTREGVYG